MSKLKVVRKGWRLDSVLSIRTEGAKFFTGKIPYFEASQTEPSGAVITPGGWRGGERWEASSKPLPWGLPGVV